MSKERYIQYGCGFAAPTGWRNFDASPTLRFERIPLLGRLHTRNAIRFPDAVEYGDIVRGLPVAANSCDGVYCSHVLEHLALEDFRVALRNTRRILRPGATFRLVLPDLEWEIRRYVNSDSADAAGDFLRETSLGQERRPRGLRGAVLEWLGNSRHLWMWDFKAIASELEQAGFVEVRRASYHDSADAKFHDVENRERWDNALGVECRRPLASET